MSILLVGFSHKSAPLALRETLARLELEPLLKRLREAGAAEAVALSTCNRFELYLVPGGRLADAAAAASLLAGIAGAELGAHVYAHEGARAVAHLFEVAAGLDSLVVGETEILGQVKAAYERARAAGATGKIANVLFQRALFCGKRVRRETAIAVGQTSVASVAVQLAETIFGDLSKSQVLLLGAGAMAELTARHLLSKKVARLTLCNRTAARAEALAASLRAERLDWELFPRALETADVVIGSTGSPQPVLTRALVSAALPARAGRSLFVIDIALPRDVEEAVHGLEHVYLYRLEDLEGIVAGNMRSRSGEVEAARRIAAALSAEFSRWLESLDSGSELSLKHSVAEAA